MSEPRSVFRILASGVSIALLASACSGEAQDMGPRATLIDAASRTLAAKSFHVDSVLTYNGEEHQGEADYVAPDRFSMVGFGGQEAKSITIGKDNYVDALDPGHFYAYRWPCDFSVETFFPTLGVVRLAKEVQLDGDTYEFTLEGEGEPEGEARIENGYVVFLSLSSSLAVEAERVQERYAISDFGADIRIERPPASQVDEEPESDVIVGDSRSHTDCSAAWEPPA
jgi:predicted RNA-binding protein with TRAM domain